MYSTIRDATGSSTDVESELFCIGIDWFQRRFYQDDAIDSLRQIKFRTIDAILPYLHVHVHTPVRRHVFTPKVRIWQLYAMASKASNLCVSLS